MSDILSAVNNQKCIQYFINHKSSKFEWNKYYLTYDPQAKEGQEWSVIRLNLFQRLFRRLGLLYKNTHRKNIERPFAKTFVRLDADDSYAYEVLDRISHQLSKAVKKEKAVADEEKKLQKEKQLIEKDLSLILNSEKLLLVDFYLKHNAKSSFYEVIEEQWSHIEKKIDELGGKKNLYCEDWSVVLYAYAKIITKDPEAKILDQVIEWSVKTKDSEASLLRAVYFVKYGKASFNPAGERNVFTVSKKAQAKTLSQSDLKTETIEKFYQRQKPNHLLKGEMEDPFGFHRALSLKIKELYPKLESIPYVLYKNPFIAKEIIESNTHVSDAYKIVKSIPVFSDWISNKPEWKKRILEECIKEKDIRLFDKIVSIWEKSLFIKNSHFITKDFVNHLENNRDKFEIDNAEEFAKAMLFIQGGEVKTADLKLIVILFKNLLFDENATKLIPEVINLLKGPQKWFQSDLSMVLAICGNDVFSEKLFTQILEKQDDDLIKTLIKTKLFYCKGLISALSKLPSDRLKSLDLESDLQLNLSMQYVGTLKNNSHFEGYKDLDRTSIMTLYKLTPKENQARFLFRCLQSVKNIVTYRFPIVFFDQHMEEIIDLCSQPMDLNHLLALAGTDTIKYFPKISALLLKATNDPYYDVLNMRTILGLKLLKEEISLDTFVSDFDFDSDRSESKKILSSIYLNLPRDKQADFIEKIPATFVDSCLSNWLEQRFYVRGRYPLFKAYLQKNIGANLPEDMLELILINNVPEVLKKTGLNLQDYSEKFSDKASKELFAQFWKKKAPIYNQIKAPKTFSFHAGFEHLTEASFELLKEALNGCIELDADTKKRLSKALNQYNKGLSPILL